VQFTASEELHAKLERATELASHAVPVGDLAALVERALDALIEREEKRRYGARRQTGKQKQGDDDRCDCPRGQSAGARARVARHGSAGASADGEKPGTSKARSRAIPATVRREVYERDGGRCTHVDAQGRRCAERRYLHFEHRTPFARGGASNAENLTLLCSAHNHQAAVRSFGAAKISRAVARGSPAAESG
jgi:hypothetical protein